jgi:tetratricopeptide (TPR) repeat protein
LRSDSLGQNLVLCPFGTRFASSPLFRSPGAWAYYVLLTASAVSFVLARRELHPGRLLVWLALSALSIYQARMIPFFAVVAAPVLALNVQEWARRRLSLHRSLTLLAGRLGVLVGIVLLVLVWPGWLQLAPYQPRGWTIVPDRSLVRMAEYLKQRHAACDFRPDRSALTFSLEVAHYLAWFCPEERGFVDSRLPLFDGVADDYVRMRRCLLQEGGDGQELSSLLDAHRLDRILLYDPDWERMARAYRYLFLAAADWELLAVEGSATLFRRRSMETAPSPQIFDYRRAVYHPTPEQRVPPAPRSPQPPSWIDILRPPLESGSADREEAAIHVLSSNLQPERFAVPWLAAQTTGVIGCGSGTEPAATGVALAIRFHLVSRLPPTAPEPLLLAVRAARRALACNPDDARAFLLLGEAYFPLTRKTREANWQTLLPELAAFRQAQVLAALEQAASLRPDLDPAHELLAQLYLETNQLDRCLDHLRARLQIAEKSAKHIRQAAALRADIDKVQQRVDQSEKTYQANLTGKTDPSKVLDRAQLAMSWGLSRKALEMLQESSPAIFGIPGVVYQLDLMMQAGQSYDIRDELGPENDLQINGYHWLRACAAASCGDYSEADAELEKDSERFRWMPNTRVPVRSYVAYHVGGAVLTRPFSVIYFQPQALLALELATATLRQEANRQVLRGLLALEAGEVESAMQHFRAAQDTWRSDAATAVGVGLDFTARPIAQEMLRRMED